MFLLEILISIYIKDAFDFGNRARWRIAKGIEIFMNFEKRLCANLHGLPTTSQHILKQGTSEGQRGSMEQGIQMADGTVRTDQELSGPSLLHPPFLLRHGIGAAGTSQGKVGHLPTGISALSI